jgi:glutaredoxin
VIQVFQAEWCPYSAMLRERLTELGVDYVARQVAPTPPERDALREATGQDRIPAVVFEDGEVLAGPTEEIIAGVEARFDPWPFEEGHVRQFRAHQG